MRLPTSTLVTLVVLLALAFAPLYLGAEPLAGALL